MARKQRPKSASQYLRRLLEDEYVQGQLRNAAGGLRGVYQRASKRPAKAAQDKKLYGNLRQSATSMRNALVALRRPEPEPPKHRVRKVAATAAVLGASVLVLKLAPKQPQSEAASYLPRING